jgi:type II secretory ATPase GspE/PulE/Tfp pilus assembly ATPase PilB-like protein
LPETKEEVIQKENKIYDINVNSIDDVLKLLLLKKYDFVTFEPNDVEIKLEFRKDGVITETKFIKYPVYSGILMKAKNATKLKLDTTTEEQE